MMPSFFWHILWYHCAIRYRIGLTPILSFHYPNSAISLQIQVSLSTLDCAEDFWWVKRLQKCFIKFRTSYRHWKVKRVTTVPNSVARFSLFSILSAWPVWVKRGRTYVTKNVHDKMHEIGLTRNWKGSRFKTRALWSCCHS